MAWQKLLYIVGAIVVAFIIFMSIKSNPEMYSGKNINKSLFTLGILALLLIGFIAFLVLMLRNS